MYTKKSVFKEFIDTYFNLLKNIKDKVNNKDFNHFYNKNYLLKRTNVKLFINTWYNEISKKFFNQIMSDDIIFFLNKDFKSTFKGLNSEFNINYYLDNLKTIYSKVEKSVFNYYVEQIKKLTKLSIIYFNTK
tara:strand:+ start:13538 stop:13933 length:396 start_codon:yes stop_codon:yes gene_type:complete